MTTTETKICQNCKQNFTIESDDFNFYKKIDVPPPTFCPECRMQRRMTWRNERFLYRRNCDLCNKPIISIYKPQSPYKVYCHRCFRSDNWDPLNYGQDYDFGKPFFEQFQKLQRTVPRLYAMVTDCVDSEYVNGAYQDKNCYLIFASDRDEDCSYSHSIFYCKDVFDSLGVRYGEMSASCVDCEKISNCFYCQDCTDSFNLYFSKNCAGCHDCFGCVNLRNKQFCIFNKPFSKEAYQEQLAALQSSSFAHSLSNREKSEKLQLDYPVKYYHGKNNVNSTGDYLTNTKNCKSIFDGQEMENCKYLYVVNRVKDSYDGYAVVENIELNLEVISSNSSSNKFGFCFWESSFGTYADTCENCHNVFGCIGLRSKSYCIFNKQYTKEAYEALTAKIIEQMSALPYVDKNGIKYGYGEFYPSEISPFSYNETVAQEFFPLTRERAEAKHYTWFDTGVKENKATVEAKDLPDNINDVGQELTKEIVGCLHAGKCGHQCTLAFRLLPADYNFYKKMSIPLPRLCPNCRHYELMSKRNPLKLWKRKCMCAREGSTYHNTTGHFHGTSSCPNEFETSYAPERPEIVYCEQCYNAEVV